MNIKDFLKLSPNESHEKFTLVDKINFVIKKDGNTYVTKVQYLGTVKNLVVTDLH